MSPYKKPPANKSLDGNIGDRADTRVGDQELVSGRTVESSCVTSSSKSQWLSRSGGVLFDVGSESSARRRPAGGPVSQSRIEGQRAGTVLEQDGSGYWSVPHPYNSSEALAPPEDDSSRAEADERPQAIRGRQLALQRLRSPAARSRYRNLRPDQCLKSYQRSGLQRSTVLNPAQSKKTDLQ